NDLAIIQGIPDGLPIDPRGLHNEMRNLMLAEPVCHRQQVVGEGRKAAALVAHLGTLGDTNAGDDHLLVHVEARTTGMKDFHRCSPDMCRLREPHVWNNLMNALRGSGCPLPVAQSGVRVRLRSNFTADSLVPRKTRPLCRRRTRTVIARFRHHGWGVAPWVTLPKSVGPRIHHGTPRPMRVPPPQSPVPRGSV